LVYTSLQSDLHEALKVQFLNDSVWNTTELKNYFYIGLPNMLDFGLEFLGFNTTTFMAAGLGLNEQATIIVIMNILVTLF